MKSKLVAISEEEDTLKKRKYNKHSHPEFVKGAVFAAAIAEDIQSSSIYRLEDRILLKLNIITKRQLRTYSIIQIKHESLRRYRLDSNPIEKIFAEKWEQWQSIGNTLAYLLNKENNSDWINVSQRDATVAATIIQWLGSPGGQSFLDKVQEEIEISKEE